MTKPLLCTLLLILAPALAAAQQPAGEDGAPSRSPWGIGLGAVASQSPYAGEGTRVIPVPLLSYEGERFYLRGLTGGWRLVDTPALELGLIARARLDGVDIDDLDRGQLLRNGVDPDLLDDRKRGLDAGLEAEWSGVGGELQLELLTDVSGRSRGQEASLHYGYPMRAGGGLLTPIVGATWWSSDLADYYYGTRPAEVARGVRDYRPGAVTIPHVGVSFLRPLGRTWSLVGSLRYSRLPGAIGDSPLVDPGTNHSASLFLGISRGFRPWWLRGQR